MEVQLNTLNEKSKKVKLKIHRGEVKFMTNVATTQKLKLRAKKLKKWSSDNT